MVLGWKNNQPNIIIAFHRDNVPKLNFVRGKKFIFHISTKEVNAKKMQRSKPQKCRPEKGIFSGAPSKSGSFQNIHIFTKYFVPKKICNSNPLLAEIIFFLGGGGYNPPPWVFSFCKRPGSLKESSVTFYETHRLVKVWIIV